jgi:hypothetical protein
VDDEELKPLPEKHSLSAYKAAAILSRQVCVVLLGPREAGKTMTMARFTEACATRSDDWAQTHLKGWQRALGEKIVLDAAKRIPTTGVLYGPQLFMDVTENSDIPPLPLRLCEFGGKTPHAVARMLLERMLWDAIGLCFDVDSDDSLTECASVWWPIAHEAILARQGNTGERPFVFLIATSKGTRQGGELPASPTMCLLENGGDGALHTSPNRGLRFDIDLAGVTPTDMRAIATAVIEQTRAQRIATLQTASQH